jgi:hypothetical protein
MEATTRQDSTFLFLSSRTSYYSVIFDSRLTNTNSCLFSLPFRPDGQHRLSLKRCFGTFSRPSCRPSDTSDKPPPHLWPARCRGDPSQLSHSTGPQVFVNQRWPPRDLRCPGTAAHSASSQIHTRAPSRPHPLSPWLRRPRIPSSSDWQALGRRRGFLFCRALHSTDSFCTYICHHRYRGGKFGACYFSPVISFIVSGQDTKRRGCALGTDGRRPNTFWD